MEPTRTGRTVKRVITASTITEQTATKLNQKIIESCNTIKKIVNRGACDKYTTDHILSTAAYSNYVLGTCEPPIHYPPMELIPDPLDNHVHNNNCVCSITLICHNGCSNRKKDLCPNCSKLSIQKSQFNILSQQLFHDFERYLIRINITTDKADFQSNNLTYTSCFKAYYDKQAHPVKLIISSRESKQENANDTTTDVTDSNIDVIKNMYTARIIIKSEYIRGFFRSYIEKTSAYDIAYQFSTNTKDILVSVYTCTAENRKVVKSNILDENIQNQLTEANETINRQSRLIQQKQYIINSFLTLVQSSDEREYRQLKEDSKHFINKFNY
jgi:hypothetical protein